jgi:hypothetical protein
VISQDAAAVIMTVLPLLPPLLEAPRAGARLEVLDVAEDHGHERGGVLAGRSPASRRGQRARNLDLPAPPSSAMRAVTMRTGALGRLELITQIPGYDSIAAAARALYGGRDGALPQMIRKIETAAGFLIVDRSSTPREPTGKGREFMREAFQVLRIAQAAEAARAR